MSAMMETKEDKLLENAATTPAEARPVPMLSERLVHAHDTNPYFKRKNILHPLLEHPDNEYWTAAPAAPTPSCDPLVQQQQQLRCLFCGGDCCRGCFPLPLNTHASGGYEVYKEPRCSLNCVKGQILRDKGAFCNQRLNWFTSLVADFYDVRDDVVVMDPRLFKHNGGHIDHQEWLDGKAVRPTIILRGRPFVDAPFVMEHEFQDPQSAAAPAAVATTTEETKTTTTTPTSTATPTAAVDLDRKMKTTTTAENNMMVIDSEGCGKSVAPTSASLATTTTSSTTAPKQEQQTQKKKQNKNKAKPTQPTKVAKPAKPKKQSAAPATTPTPTSDPKKKTTTKQKNKKQQKQQQQPYLHPPTLSLTSNITATGGISSGNGAVMATNDKLQPLLALMSTGK